MSLLPRHVGGFQCHSIGIALVGEFLKQLLLDHGVGKTTDLVVLQPGSIKSNAQLLLCQLGALLRQHLRWQVARPSFPIAFLTQDVNGRMLLLSGDRIDVVGLLGDGTLERVGLIDDRNAVLHLGLRRLEHIHLGSAAMLVGAEGQVGTLRKVVRVTIHGHALEVVITVDENTHLGVMHAGRKAEIDRFGIDEHDAIPLHALGSAKLVFGVHHLDSLAVKRNRIVKCSGSSRFEILERFGQIRDAITMLIQTLFALDINAGSAEHLDRGLLARTGGQLILLEIANRIALILKDLDRGLQLVGRDPQI